MKKTLCLLLAVIMILGITACGKSGTTTEPTATSSADVSATATAGTDTASDIPDLSGRTITLLTTDTWVSGLSVSDILPRFKQIEERTGCTIVWETAPGGDDYKTVVQTRLTGDSSTCPDIILLPTETATIAKYIDDGLLYDITKAYDVCPNIKEFYETYRTDLKGSFTYNDGGIYNLLANVWRYPDEQAKWAGVSGDNAIWYRADIAAELGFNTYPTTMDDLYKLLTAVKAAYPDMVPMHMWDWSCWESARIFDSAYGLHFNNDQSGSYFYADESGKVQFEPATDATKAWLTEMNKWYKEGLIVVGSSEDQKIGAAANGTTFSGFYSGVTATCEEALKAVDPDAYFNYMPFPSVDGYDTTLMPRAAFSNSFVIVNNGDEEQCRAALQFLDYAFLSDYGVYSEQAGVEGEGWSFGADGSFVPNEDYVKSIVNKEVVLQASGANIHFNGPSVYLFDVNEIWKEANDKVKAELGIKDPMNDEQLANWKEINKINSSYYCSAYPTMYMSDEDLATFNALTTDLNTFTDEMLEKYILGTADLSKFDTDFVAVLHNSMNLDQALALQQKYYDAYLKNSGK